MKSIAAGRTSPCLRKDPGVVGTQRKGRSLENAQRRCRLTHHVGIQHTAGHLPFQHDVVEARRDHQLGTGGFRGWTGDSIPAGSIGEKDFPAPAFHHKINRILNCCGIVRNTIAFCSAFQDIEPQSETVLHNQKPFRNRQRISLFILIQCLERKSQSIRGLIQDSDLDLAFQRPVGGRDMTVGIAVIDIPIVTVAGSFR